MESLGMKPLPGRINIVMTHSNHVWDGFVSANTLDEAIISARNGWRIVSQYGKLFKGLNKRKEILVIGGEEIYKLFLNRAVRIYATLIDAEFHGDRVFPELSTRVWEENGVEMHPADEANRFRYSFVEFRRR